MESTLNITSLNLADPAPLRIPGPLDAVAIRLGGRELPVIAAVWRDYVGGQVAADLGAGMDGQLWESVTLTPGPAQIGTVDIITSYSDSYDYPRPLALGADLIPTYTAHLPWARPGGSQLRPPVSMGYNTTDIKVRDVDHNFWVLELSYNFSAVAEVLATGETWKINTILTWDITSAFWMSPNLVPPDQDPLTTAMSIWMSTAQITSTPNVWQWTLIAGGWPYSPAWETLAASAAWGATPPTANPWLNDAAVTVALTHVRLSEI